jgi:GT2 family glycosyltransferase
MDAAIITPFYNARDHVAPWAQCLLAQTASCGVYAVDDGSDDDTAELVEQQLRDFPGSAVLLRGVENKGPAAARNLGIRRALDDGARLILLLDADTRVAPDWVARHLAFHRDRPGVMVMGGGLRGEASTPMGRADGFASWFTSVPGSRPRTVRLLHISSNNMSIKADVFSVWGVFFDEELTTGEDLIFCREVQRRGSPPWLQPDIVATHRDRDSAEAAREHHYTWGRHARNVVARQGGYYSLLASLPSAAVTPLLAVATTSLTLAAWLPTHPEVLLHAPLIAYLKWHHARGVRDSFNP